MAERTMTIRYLSFRERGKPNGACFPASNVDGNGTSSADLFFDWVRAADPFRFSDLTIDRVILVQNCEKTDGGVLVKLKSRHYGEAGELVDAGTIRTLTWIADDVAPTAPHRLFFHVPEYGSYALYFSESSTRCGMHEAACTVAYAVAYTSMRLLRRQIPASRASDEGHKARDAAPSSAIPFGTISGFRPSIHYLTVGQAQTQ